MNKRFFLFSLGCLIILNAFSGAELISSDLFSGFNVFPFNTENTGLTLGSNFRVFPDTIVQVESSVCTSPLNPKFIACAAITDYYGGGYTTGVYVSTNGGYNWSGTEAIKTSSGAIIVTVGDPYITIDKNGWLILSYIAPGNSIGISYSTNNGLNWTSTVTLSGVTQPDKVSNTSDNSPSSPYNGNVYLVYNEREGINFSKSTNGGQSWSTSQKISPTFSYLRTGASIATGEMGEIYVTWPYLADTLKYIGFAKSTDGGNTWTSSDLAFPVYPVNTGFRINLNLVKTNGLPQIAVDKSGGVRNGWIYVVCSERNHIYSPAYDSCDIVVHCSTNKGLSWPYKYKVNQDSGSYKHQTFPSISIDNTGGINILYYDDRNTQTRDSFQVYLSRSTNGGQNFTDYNLSGYKFKLKQLPSSKYLFGVPSYIGSYCGITFSENRIIPVWYDNYSGEDYQLRTSVIELSPKSFIKVIPEGHYNILTDKLNARDTLRFRLRISSSPYYAIDSSVGVIDSVTSSCELTFANAPTGNYYIEIMHKNSLETWSKLPQFYSQSSGINYDFTDSASKAFGNNMIHKGNRFCIYSGDINKDGIIDPTDMTEIDNAVAEFMTGYLLTDLNGDRVVDSSDLLICDNNVSNFILKSVP